MAYKSVVVMAHPGLAGAPAVDSFPAGVVQVGVHPGHVAVHHLDHPLGLVRPPAVGVGV
ncbi:MAG: hypothetical protein ACRDZO_07940 [Egibacteraceae bacterium]